ncbi:MAG: SOS response-associated peptidase [Nitrospiria bacterium]
MCGRASTTFTDQELSIRYLDRRPLVIPDLRPNYNLAPTQNTVVLRVVEHERKFNFMRFGLIPAWAASIASVSRYSLINAKSEEVTEKRSYKNAFEKRRCIVPLSSFFEWKKTENGPKKPFCIRLKNDPILSVAGIWEHWKSKDETEKIFSFAMMTTAANDFMQKIHTRMPVILDPSDEERWLDPENTNVTELRKILKPCPSEWLDAYEVTTLVNSPRNNKPEVLQPAHAG